MTPGSSKSDQRAAVRMVEVRQIHLGLNGLDGYRQALIVFRDGENVVGHDWIPVQRGQINEGTLRHHLKSAAWPIWANISNDLLPEKKTFQTPKASIIVCTRDRTDELKKCIKHLLPYARKGHEVVIVDSSPSDDSTARLVSQYPQLRYVKESLPGAGRARNRGIQESTNEWIAFTDDDALVDPKWLPNLLKNFEDPLVGAVTGITMPVEIETAAQLWFEKVHGFSRGFTRREFDFETLNPLSGGVVGASVNMALRRSALEHIGLFDECLGPGTPSGSGEDHELFYRVLAKGYRIVYDPSALVWHRHKESWRALERNVYGYGLGVFAWWTRALLFERELGVLPLASRYFFQHHFKNLVKSVLRRPGRIPFTLAWAEFKGALCGPGNYFRSRKIFGKQQTTTRSRKELLAMTAPGTTPALEKPRNLP